MEPLLWSSPDDTPTLWDRFTRHGVCWVRMTGAAELAQHAPNQLLEQLLGWTPFVTQVNHIKVTNTLRPGIRPYAVTNDEARFHIDQHPYLPPALQVLVCMRQASDPGGESAFLDSWELLDAIAADDRALFAALFETQRAIRFHNFIWHGPTMSLRAGNLVCVHNGFPHAHDEVGVAFQDLVERYPPIRFRLETGDLLISNNHRTLHARSAFTDTRRHLIRILAWLHRPLAAPERFVRRATPVALLTEELARGEPMWVRKRLGFSGLAPGFESYDEDDLRAHYRGELAENVAAQAQLVRAHQLAARAR